MYTIYIHIYLPVPQNQDAFGRPSPKHREPPALSMRVAPQMLATASWDASVKLYNIFDSNKVHCVQPANQELSQVIGRKQTGNRRGWGVWVAPAAPKPNIVDSNKVSAVKPAN